MGLGFVTAKGSEDSADENAPRCGPILLVSVTAGINREAFSFVMSNITCL
jgi:hypothetical protein